MAAARRKSSARFSSIFGQSYPFIELVLIYYEEDQQFANNGEDNSAAAGPISRFASSPTSFPIDSRNDRIRALEQAQSAARGRWFVILDSDVMLDRFAVETAVEFAGSNEISALVLRPGIRCRSLLQKIIAPSMEHLLQMVRIANRRREKRKGIGFRFALPARSIAKHLTSSTRSTACPGILNDAAWNMWGYQVEGLRTFECGRFAMDVARCRCAVMVVDQSIRSGATAPVLPVLSSAAPSWPF